MPFFKESYIKVKFKMLGIQFILKFLGRFIKIGGYAKEGIFPRLFIWRS